MDTLVSVSEFNTYQGACNIQNGLLVAHNVLVGEEFKLVSQAFEFLEGASHPQDGLFQRCKLLLVAAPQEVLDLADDISPEEHAGDGQVIQIDIFMVLVAKALPTSVDLCHHLELPFGIAATVRSGPYLQAHLDRAFLGSKVPGIDVVAEHTRSPLDRGAVPGGQPSLPGQVGRESLVRPPHETPDVPHGSTGLI